jgi:raffinose/stachyose/melibiose transport system substrate-binding protein
MRKERRTDVMRKTLIRAGAALGALMLALPAFAQELSFWSWRQEDKAVYEKLIATFQADNPGITVKFSAFEPTQYNTILSTALAGGTGPDLMMVRAYGGLETMASPGYLMKLDTAKVPALSGFAPAALAAETMRSDKGLYAVPFASQTMLVIYNKAIFDKNGLSEPKSWDDFTAAAKKLKAAGIIPFANGTSTAWQNETIVSALTSSIMGKGFYEDLMAGKADFNDARFVTALAKLKEISASFSDGFIGLDYASSQQLFTSGMAAMFAGGSFELASFLKQNPDLKLGIFAAPGLKDTDDKLVGLYFDGGYAANAKTKSPEAALKFLNYVADKKFGQVFANGLGNISPIPGVTFENPLLARVADLNKNAIPYIFLVHFRYGEPSGSVLIQSEVQKLLAGKQDAAAAAKAVTSGLATWYAPFKK